MGLERNGAALFLKLFAEGVRPARVLTLGHQNVHLDSSEYRRVLQRLGIPDNGTVPKFVDELFFRMGAASVDAMDVADYEEANVIHDLNQPVPSEWHQQYDLIFDGGTLEHIFNFPTAIKNCMQMLKLGGRFISVTMPNNWCGHGFYQFSPELFYRVLSPSNGFSIREMYITSLTGEAYLVSDPESVRSRVELCNDAPVFLLVHSRRDAVVEIFSQVPQQSDYVKDWATAKVLAGHASSRPWKVYPGVRQLRELRAFLRCLLRERRMRKERSLDNARIYTPANLEI